VGLLVKNKLFRYCLRFVALGFLLLTISTIRKHSADIKSETGKFCGTFKIDNAKSAYEGIDLAKHTNLLLKVSVDSKFYFVGDTIPFKAQGGTWKFTDNEDGGYLECFFGAKKIHAYRSFDNQVWTFESDCLANSVDSDVIRFSRQK
jgi:hypothetical protein